MKIMKAFIEIFEKITQVDEIVKRNEDLDVIIATFTKHNCKFIWIWCES